MRGCECAHHHDRSVVIWPLATMKVQARVGVSLLQTCRRAARPCSQLQSVVVTVRVVEAVVSDLPNSCLSIIPCRRGRVSVLLGAHNTRAAAGASTHPSPRVASVHATCLCAAHPAQSCPTAAQLQLTPASLPAGCRTPLPSRSSQQLAHRGAPVVPQGDLLMGWYRLPDIITEPIESVFNPQVRCKITKCRQGTVPCAAQACLRAAGAGGWEAAGVRRSCVLLLAMQCFPEARICGVPLPLLRAWTCAAASASGMTATAASSSSFS
jgi:hypothetical protein